MYLKNLKVLNKVRRWSLITPKKLTKLKHALKTCSKNMLSYKVKIPEDINQLDWGFLQYV